MHKISSCYNQKAFMSIVNINFPLIFSILIFYFSVVYVICFKEESLSKGICSSL